MKFNITIFFLAFGLIGLALTLMFHGTEYLLQALPMGWRMVIQVVVFTFAVALFTSYSGGGKK